MNQEVIVIGGGLAGVEAAYQLSKRGINVKLYEMRPKAMTEAHSTDYLSELVCSNSLGSDDMASASGLLKHELKILDSFVLRIAEESRVPAGRSFSVDRIDMAKRITEEIEKINNIEVIREEVKEIDDISKPIIIATGPLTSMDFSVFLTKITLRKNLFFFDATSPIINADSIDYEKVFYASRYDKGDADFINIPLDEQEYKSFVNELVNAERVALKDFEKDKLFEDCLPIEEIASRGEMTLAFGPLKPVGLINPKTGKHPFAVVQLRQDDLNKKFYQMVGFQTRLKWGEQKRIFRMLKGLENAEFERFGRMHRNTYINAPLILNDFFQTKTNKNIFFAGQICGVEGYVESIASGLLTGIFMYKLLKGENMNKLPLTTATGSLVNYISHSDWKNFRPTKFSFGLLPELEERIRKKRDRKIKKSERAINDIKEWLKANT